MCSDLSLSFYSRYDLLKLFQVEFFFEKMNLTLEKAQYLDLTFNIFSLIFQDVTHMIHNNSNNLKILRQPQGPTFICLSSVNVAHMIRPLPG